MDLLNNDYQNEQVFDTYSYFGLSIKITRCWWRSRARPFPFLASDGLWTIWLGKSKTCKSQNEYEIELHDDVERLDLGFD